MGVACSKCGRPRTEFGSIGITGITGQPDTPGQPDKPVFRHNKLLKHHSFLYSSIYVYHKNLCTKFDEFLLRFEPRVNIWVPKITGFWLSQNSFGMSISDSNSKTKPLAQNLSLVRSTMLLAYFTWRINHYHVIYTRQQAILWAGFIIFPFFGVYAGKRWQTVSVSSWNSSLKIW